MVEASKVQELPVCLERGQSIEARVPIPVKRNGLQFKGVIEKTLRFAMQNEAINLGAAQSLLLL